VDRVVPLIYTELRQLADRHLRRERAGHTLTPTALVHEAYFKLSGGSSLGAQDRAHLLALASRAMRQVLVDHARKVMTHKRGGGWHATTLTDGAAPMRLSPEDLIALDSALEGLEERQRRVVECRFFGGMEETEIAAALDVSERTVRRDWVKARAWLYRSLYPDAPEVSAG
jgi:RNA polymerase sigma factor (TIGR02999 family)